MAEYVLDAAALIALIRRESGAEIVAAVAKHSLISSVNFSETLAKALERGATLERALAELRLLKLRIISFDEDLAIMAASFRPATKHLGLSFADRACLALGLKSGLPILTADRRLAAVKTGAKVEVIR